MNLKRKISITLNVIYVVALLLFLLDALSPIEIKNQEVKSFAYITTIIGSPLILLWNLNTLKTKHKKIIGGVIPLVVIIGLIIVNPLNVFFSSIAWKTELIEYQSATTSNRKIEFQLQDMGALGYNKRTVEVYYLSPLFTIVTTPEHHPDGNPDWIKTDIEVNETGLKFP